MAWDSETSWMVDADAHYYEPDDAFTRHIEADLRDQTLWIDRSNGGKVMLGADRQGFFSVGVGDHIGPPGLLKQYFRDKGTFVMPNTEPMNALEIPEFTDRSARLAQMDQHRVRACFMLPTWGVGVEPELRERPDVCAASIRAFNRWVEDDWGFGDRIVSAALLSLADVDEAIAEVERLLLLGCRLFCVSPGPVHGHSPGDPMFDGVWARLADAGGVVVHHIGATGSTAGHATSWGERAHPPSHRHSALEMYLGFAERPVTDTWAAMILHNVFGRHPGLQVASIENGASWLPYLAGRLDRAVMSAVNKDSWRFGELDAAPSEILRRNFSVVPFYEDDVVPIVDCIGSDRVLAGSDWPHPEGLAVPHEFLEELTAFDADTVEAIMATNAAALVGLSAV